MYEGMPNEGMRGIRQLIEEFEADCHMPVKYDVFDVRLKCEVPGADYDIYIRGIIVGAEIFFAHG
jgi:hypothetical protein